MINFKFATLIQEYNEFTLQNEFVFFKKMEYF